jgi:hypothetical protein
MRAATIYSGTGPLTILASPLSEVAYQMADTNIAKHLFSSAISAFQRGVSVAAGKTSIKDNVKDWVGCSGNVPLPVVNNKIEEYITAQQQEFEISIYANGPYDLADTRGYLRNERHIWNGMNVEERKVALSNFWKSTLSFVLSTQLLEK